MICLASVVALFPRLKRIPVWGRLRICLVSCMFIVHPVPQVEKTVDVGQDDDLPGKLHVHPRLKRMKVRGRLMILNNK